MRWGEGLRKSFSVDFQSDVLPQVQLIASQSLVEIRPQVEQEFQKLNTRVPELSQTSMQQLELLQKNISTRSQKVLETSLGAMLVQKEDKVRQMFPDVAPDKVEKAMNNIATETQNRLLTSHETLFSSHIAALNGIVVNIDKIQQSERVQSNAEAAGWETAASLLDLVNDQVQEFRPVVAVQSKSSQVAAPKISGQNNSAKSNADKSAIKSTSSTRSSAQTSTKTSTNQVKAASNGGSIADK